MRDAIRKRAGDFTAIVVLMVIALGVAGYVLHNERFRFPFIPSAPFKLKAELATAQAVVAGQGPTGRGAGGRIGGNGGGSSQSSRAPACVATHAHYKTPSSADAPA